MKGKKWLWFGIGFLLMSGVLMEVKAEEEKNLLANSSFETTTEAKRYPAKFRSSTSVCKGWNLCAGSKDALCGLTDETAVEGKYSFKMSKEKGFMYLISSYRKVSEFKGPCLVSCYLKTEGKDAPRGSGVVLKIWTRKKGGGNGPQYAIARVRTTTDWTKLSGRITRDMVRFQPNTELWGVAICAYRFSGTVWVDDVKLIQMGTSALKFSLDSKEYFLDQGSCTIKGTVDPTEVGLGKRTLDVMLLDEKVECLEKTRGVLKSKDFSISLNIAGLKEGTYTVKVNVVDKKGKTISQEQKFKKIKGPYDNI